MKSFCNDKGVRSGRGNRLSAHVPNGGALESVKKQTARQEGRRGRAAAESSPLPRTWVDRRPLVQTRSEDHH